MQVDHRLLAGRLAETFRGSPAGGARYLAEGPHAAAPRARERWIVHRQPKGAVPAPVEYSLTVYGRSLLPLVEDVRLWGKAHMDRLTSQADGPMRDS